ncbi:MAG: MFS transporter [Phaeodactylibacter sp.]|nr:MFS transporter [Phaeodactylibacter sp.]
MRTALVRVIRVYRFAYAGHPREIWALAVLTVINRMGTMVLPFLTIYLSTVLGYSLSDAGLLAGAFGFGALGGVYLAGRLSDRFGTSPVILGSLLASGVFFISLQYAEGFYGLFALIFCAGLFGEAYRPAVMTSVGSYVPPAQAGRSMALLRLAVSLGMSAAPAIGGFVAVALGYAWLFWIDGLTCIAAGLYFWAVSRRWGRRASKPEEEAGGTTNGLAPQRDPNYLRFLLATFLMGFGFIQWFQSVPVFIKTEWGFDERYIGTLMACSSLLIILVELPAIHAIEQAGRMRASILAGLALGGLSFLLFLLPKALVLCFLAMALWTLGGVFFLPFNNGLPLKMAPAARRGEYMAWYWMTWSLNGILGPVLGLAFVEQWGWGLFWVGLAGLAGASWWMNWGRDS